MKILQLDDGYFNIAKKRIIEAKIKAQEKEEGALVNAKNENRLYSTI